ncbi:MAG: hypothetical protein ACRDMX_11135 [Solirubrobacteraceae bacterium]
MSTTVSRHALGLTWVEDGGLRRAAHALVAEGRIWLIDPFEDEVALSAVTELGAPAAVIQLLDRHDRDCARIAQRLEVARMRLPAAVPGSPFSVVRVIARRWWNEMALWWADERALVVAEAVGTAPAFALHRTLGVHPLLRFSPPRSALTSHDPERLFVGHGSPLQSGANDALVQALAAARSDLPRLALRLPSLLRGG